MHKVLDAILDSRVHTTSKYLKSGSMLESMYILFKITVTKKEYSIRLQELTQSYISKLIENLRNAGLHVSG